MILIFTLQIITNKEPLRPFKDTYVNPNNPYVQIDKLYYQGKFSESASLYEKELPRAYTDEQKFRTLSGLAWSYIGIGRFLEAADYFERASVLAKQPNQQLEIKLGVSFVWLFSRRFDRALQNVELAKSIYITDKEGLAQLHFLEACIFWESGNRNRAEQKFNEVFNNYPNTLWGQKSLLVLAKAYIQSGEQQKGIEYLNKVIERAKDEEIISQASLLLFDIHMNAGKVDEAIEALTKVIENSPNTEVSRQAEARIAQIAEQYRSRLITNDHLLSKSRTAAVFILYNPGIRAYYNKDYFTAKPLLEKFIKLYPEDTLSQRVAIPLSAIYIDEKELQKAIDVLKLVNLNRLDKENLETAQYFLATSYLGISDFQNAAFYYSKLLNSQKFSKEAEQKLLAILNQYPEYVNYLPSTHPFYNRISAISSLKAGDTLGAINSLERYLSSNPNDTIALLSIIDLSYKKKDYNRTLKYAKQYISKNLQTNRDIILYIAGASAYSLNYYGEALEYWDELLASYSNSQFYERALNFSRQLLTERPELFSLNLKSQALLKEKEYQKVYDLFKRKMYNEVINALANDNSEQALLLKSQSYLNLKDYQNAYLHISRITKETPEIAFIKAEALFGMNKLRDAYIYYKKALESQNPQIQNISQLRIQQLEAKGIK
ncbi:MAG: tetratricopeptide repeat protein [candidate division WOR-3 bacterium]|nr:tetratricopeptide repeat protein [candidate division WOR-3 bacterium]MDW8150345.1 tetratricopeptide repeat protein [candidate division WOR-3 bacterium]